MINYSHHAVYYVHVTSFCNWNFVIFDPLNPFCPPLHPDLWQPPISSLSLSYILSYSFCVLCILHIVLVAKINFKKKKSFKAATQPFFHIHKLNHTLFAHFPDLYLLPWCFEGVWHNARISLNTFLRYTDSQWRVASVVITIFMMIMIVVTMLIIIITYKL